MNPSIDTNISPYNQGQPIVVSPTEAVIDCFWIPGFNTINHWKVKSDRAIASIALTKTWDATNCVCSIDQGHAKFQLSRTYDLDIAPYQYLRIRLRMGSGVSVSIAAKVSGCEVAVSGPVEGQNSSQEIVGAIPQGRLESLSLMFSFLKRGTYPIEFKWIMLETSTYEWVPPTNPFADMLSSDTDVFGPGLGLVMSPEQCDALRNCMMSPSYQHIIRSEIYTADQQFQTAPETMIRQYALYAPRRYGRKKDEAVDLNCDGLQLAIAGMLTRNADYMMQAAKHTIAICRIEHWSEGFIDRTPQLPWYHAGFAPNVMTIKASLLLDWTWSWLTPQARGFIRGAIRDKGLKYLEQTKNAMVNQGIRFNKGRILGHLAVYEDRQDSSLRLTIQDAISTINHKLSEAIRPDGTFSEGIDYGKGTIASTFISYVAAAQYLDVPVAKLVSPLILRSMHYLIDAECGLPPVFAAFAAGPMECSGFSNLVTPTKLMQSCACYESDMSGQYCELVSYGLPNIWAETQKELGRTVSKPFSIYPDGGWIFMGNDESEQPRVVLESGLWDGHGHAWMRKNALTINGWGQDILLPRNHVNYEDARCEYTQSTKLNNTFTPNERNQDAKGTAGCGGVIKAAIDLGIVVIAESDCATAWQHGVKSNNRRVMFFRPDLLLIEDVMSLDVDESGVQSWNSLSPWVAEEMPCCWRSNLSDAGVRVWCLTAKGVTSQAGEDSVHMDPDTGNVMPTYRATFRTPPRRYHRLLTLIQVYLPDKVGASAAPVVNHHDEDLIDVEHDDLSLRFVHGSVSTRSDRAWGWGTDGDAMLIIKRHSEINCVVAFGAGRIASGEVEVSGSGLLWHVPCHDEDV